jgi:hypothetical protein
MNRFSGRTRLCLGTLAAFVVLLFAHPFAHGQSFPFPTYQLDWTTIFNNSAGGDTEDNWVANSYAAMDGATRIVSVSLPLFSNFTDQPITALIYQGFDLMDPTAGGGLVLMAQQDATFSHTPGTFSVVTVTFDNPVTFNPGDIFYAAVLIRGIPPDKYPFLLNGTSLRGQSFFDVGLTLGGPYDINQLPAHSANITPLGGVHPVVGGGIQDPGTLSLWATGVAP